MIVIYLHQFHFPSERAHTIQMVHSAAALAARGVETHLLAKRNAAFPIDSIAEGLRFYGVDPAPGLRVHLAPVTGRGRVSLLNRWQALRAMAGSRGREVIIVVRKERTARELVRYRRLSLRPFRVVLELHDIPSLLDRPYAEVEQMLADQVPYRARLRESGRLAGVDGIITITDAMRHLLRRGTDLDVPMATIRSGVELSRFAAARGSREATTAPAATVRERRVMYTGQFWSWKGVDVLVQAIASLPPEVRLEVVGGDIGGLHGEEIMGAAQRSGLRARIRYHGFVPHGRVHELFRRADCLVLPNQRNVRSGFFTSPIKLFEYMASGVPIVATGLPAIREVLRHEENAVLVEPDAPEALAAGIERVLDDRELATRIAAQARAEAERYTWVQRGDDLERFLRELVRSGSGRLPEIAPRMQREAPRSPDPMGERRSS